LYAALTAFLCRTATKRKICKSLLGPSKGAREARRHTRAQDGGADFDAESSFEWMGARGTGGSKATTTSFAPSLFDSVVSEAAYAARTCSAAFESSGEDQLVELGSEQRWLNCPEYIAD